MAGSRFFSPGGWYFLEKQIRHGNPGKEPNPNVWAGVILYLQIAAFFRHNFSFPSMLTRNHERWHYAESVNFKSQIGNGVNFQGYLQILLF